MAVAQLELVVRGEMQVAFTGRDTAPQGLSFTGGGGVGEQLMVSVPQSRWFGMQGLPAWLDRMRMERSPDTIGV